MLLTSMFQLGEMPRILPCYPRAVKRAGRVEGLSDPGNFCPFLIFGCGRGRRGRFIRVLYPYDLFLLSYDGAVAVGRLDKVQNHLIIRFEGFVQVEIPTPG